MKTDPLFGRYQVAKTEKKMKMETEIRNVNNNVKYINLTESLHFRLNHLTSLTGLSAKISVQTVSTRPSGQQAWLTDHRPGPNTPPPPRDQVLHHQALLTSTINFTLSYIPHPLKSVAIDQAPTYPMVSRGYDV